MFFLFFFFWGGGGGGLYVFVFRFQRTKGKVFHENEAILPLKWLAWRCVLVEEGKDKQLFPGRFRSRSNRKMASIKWTDVNRVFHENRREEP